MVKQAVKNFFANLIYVFVTMGILYLFLLVALFAFAGSVAGSAAEMLTELTKLIHVTVEGSSTSVTAFFEYAVQEIDWNAGFFGVVAQILDSDWIRRTVSGFFEVLDASSSTFSEDFAAIVSEFASKVSTLFGLSVSTMLLGLLLANFATRFVVRRKSAPRGVKKWLVANTLVPIVQFLLVGGVLALAAEIRYYSLLVWVVLLLAYGLFALVSSWIIHGKGVPREKVINPKNLLLHLLSGAVIWLFVGAIFLLLLLFHWLIAVLVLVPLAVYGLNIMEVNTDSYVLALAEEAAAEADAPPAEKADA